MVSLLLWWVCDVVLLGVICGVVRLYGGGVFDFIDELSFVFGVFVVVFEWEDFVCYWLCLLVVIGYLLVFVVVIDWEVLWYNVMDLLVWVGGFLICVVLKLVWVCVVFDVVLKFFGFCGILVFMFEEVFWFVEMYDDIVFGYLMVDCVVLVCFFVDE